MNTKFDVIMNAPLSEEIKALVKKWDNLSENLRTCNRDVPVLLPDLFWIVQSGAGKTTFLHDLTNYLKDTGNLMDFYGNVDMFEFLLGYCPEHLPFTELQRLMDTVKSAAGFRNEFRGVISIDIDEWVEHYTERHFISFMEYLAANSEHWLILLSVSPKKGAVLQELQAFLSMYLRLETIHLDIPADDHLVRCTETYLNNCGFELDDGARSLLRNTFAALRKNRYFDGYKTAHLLAKDIVYHLYTNETSPAQMLTAQTLADFAESSRYVKSMVCAASDSRNTIGFLD